jgi:Uma2 family endonuclease
MSTESTIQFPAPFVLHMGSALTRLSRAEFYELCRLNPDLRIEQTADGDLVIMPPTGGNTGRRNFSITAQLAIWAETDATGVGFDSSTAFELPNGATRAPDASWVRRERWDALTDEERDEFPPLCPDFVVELRSRTDRVADLRAKMREYVENGARLGWLIEPYARTVEVYRPGVEPVLLAEPETVTADPELPGFTLDLAKLWA